MARLSLPTWDGVLFAPLYAAEGTFVWLAEEDSYSCWSRKETRKKKLKDFGTLKTACVNGKNGKDLELPYGKTLLQNITDDGSFQNFKFSYVERAKLKFAKMPLYGPSKLLDASKAVSKVTQIKISYKQPARFWTLGMWSKRHQIKVQQDPDTTQSISRKIATMAMTPIMTIKW